MGEKKMKKLVRKFMLVAILFAIFQLSNTPNLHVSEPKTWFNSPQYEKHFSYKHFAFKEGTFYRPYRNVKNEEFILHKISHVLFFSLLTTVIYLNLKEKRKRLFLSWVYATLFALTDEIHQSFIIGRSGRAMDIGLDSLASLLTILLIWQMIKVEKVTTLVRSHI
jgi:VanZ family protein